MGPGAQSRAAHGYVRPLRGADTGEKRGNLGPQAAFRRRLALDGIAENIAHFRFHAAAVRNRAPLQALFDLVLDMRTMICAMAGLSFCLVFAIMQSPRWDDGQAASVTRLNICSLS